MSSSSQRQYLAKVLPWPTDGEDGFINLEWTWQQPDYKSGDKYARGNRAFQSVEDAANQLNWIAANRPDMRDIYVCQSRQSQALEQTGKKNFKYYKAIRNKENATHLRSVFLDFDFKNYPSETDTTDALRSFIRGLTLQPSVIVNTGGGFHIYWTMARNLTTEEWYPLAYSLVEATKQLGLKCDTQCTIDAARILRVPETKNFKRDKKVTLVHLLDYDYSVERVEKALLPFKVTSAAQTHHVNGFTLDPTLFPKRPPPKEEDNLSSGIYNDYPLAKLDEVAKECGFVNHAVKTGGIDYAQPLWHLTTLLATFMEGGEAAAHAMGNKHPGYTQEETDKFYARKVKEQKELGLGWPSCNTINGHGSSFCKACPHLGKGKSPLHFRLPLKEPPKSDAPNSASGPDEVKTTDILPPGYTRNAKGFIQHAIVSEDGTTSNVVICEIVIGNAWLQRDPWVLNFFAEKQPGRREQISLPLEVVVSNELRKELARQGITFHDYNLKSVGAFLVSWIKTLKDTKDAVVSTSAFGWNEPHGKLEGFVYGSKLYTPKEIRVAQIPDAVTSKGYSPTGEHFPWIDAAGLITSQKRPALDAILASTFAAPLVKFTNQNGLMMSCVGESGVGKSTAMDIAMAAWGKPTLAKNLLNDTDNSVMNKVGELRNLPVYWDDLQPDDTRKYGRMVFQMSYGKEKDRMNAQAKRRESGTWQTIMISTSNISLLDFVTQNLNTSAAGLYRIFEIPVAKSVGGFGQIAKSDAARIVGKLNNNYGRVGEIYAKYLGENFEALDNEVHDYQKQLDEQINAQNEERLWTSLIACICMGAKIGNRLNLTEIDEDTLRDFMITSIGNMRGQLVDQAVDMTQEINVSNILGDFFMAHRARNTLKTNFIPIGPGHPVGVEPRSDTSRLEAIYVQMGVDDKLIRFSKAAFREWLKDKGISSRQAITAALEEKFKMKTVRGILGGGTPLSVPGKAYLYEMSLQDLEEEYIKVDDLLKP